MKAINEKLFLESDIIILNIESYFSDFLMLQQFFKNILRRFWLKIWIFLLLNIMTTF